MDDVVAVSTGVRQTMAITNDGRLWSWGDNRFGQLGIGTTDDHHNPVWIMDDVATVSTGRWHTMAIRADGSLWGWGGGNERGPHMQSYGQIGDGTREHRHSPVWIMDDVVAVSAGDADTYAIRTDGSLWVWGGYIGNSWRLVPELFMYDVATISSGPSHSLMLDTDGILWAWGWNGHGQLGNGTIFNPQNP